MSSPGSLWAPLIMSEGSGATPETVSVEDRAQQDTLKVTLERTVPGSQLIGASHPV